MTTEVNHRLWMTSVIGKELTDGEARELYMASKREAYKKDETLFREGDEAVAFFLIVSGDIDIEKSSGGTVTQIAQLGTGSIVGEMSLLTHEKRGACARVATDEAVVLRVDWRDFERLLADDRAAAYKMMVALARLLAGRLKRINLKVADLMASSGPGEGQKLEEFADFKQKLMRDWSF